jgi:hypothetical protein
MTSIKIDILCLKGQNNLTNAIKQSDFKILSRELGSKKVEINIIENINDLTFKNPIFIHDFSDCFQNVQVLNKYNDKYYIEFQAFKAKISKKENPIGDLYMWLNTYPRICFSTVSGVNDIRTITDNLILIRKILYYPSKLLEMGVIQYALNNIDYKDMIKKYLKERGVTKGFIRFNNNNNPSILVDVNDDTSFDINIKKSIGRTFNTSTLIIHPIKDEKTYRKGVISIIYVEGKYSHSVIKKPNNFNTGEREYTVYKYSPSFSLIKICRSVLNCVNFNLNSNFPIIQINFAHGTDSSYPYLLSKVNYVDPKLYLEVNKKGIKKVRKMILNKIKEFQQLDNLKKNISY